MTPHEQLLAIVDAAEPEGDSRELLYSYAEPGTLAHQYAAGLAAMRADWLKARRLAEAVPETIDAIERACDRLGNLNLADQGAIPEALYILLTALARLRTPNPEASNDPT